MPKAKKIVQFKYTTVVHGNRSFYKNVGIPIAESLAKLPSNKFSHKDGDLDESLAVNTQHQNLPLVIESTIAIVLFVAARIAEKAVDDVYEAKIQPLVKKVLKRADKTSAGGNIRKKKMYQFGVWYEQERILVLTAIVGNSFREILSHDYLLPAIRNQAIAWITKNGRQNAIHLYVLEGKTWNAKPLLFDTLAAASQHCSTI